MTDVYIVKGLISYKAVMLHCDKAMQKQVESIKGIEVYGRERSTLRITIQTKGIVLNQFNEFCLSNNCTIRELAQSE